MSYKKLKTATISNKDKSFQIVYIPDGDNHPSIYSFFDEDSVREMYWDIKPNDWVLDIGADHGSYSLTALAMGASKVFAWSPKIVIDGMQAHTIFNCSLQLNEWANKCDIYTSGIYDKKGWLNMIDKQFYDIEPNKEYGIIEVSPLDDWYDNIFKKTDYKSANGFFVKMDVEGAEIEVIKSGERFLKEIHPKILVENHKFMRDTLEQEVRELLISFGFKEVSTTPYNSVSHSLYI